MWDTDSGILSLFKKKEIMSFVNNKDIMLGEISQTQTDKITCDLTDMRNLKGRTQRSRKQNSAVGGKWVGKRETMVKGYKVLARQEE